MLVVFSGLPGTGKTTIAKALTRATHAVYLRIDTLEQAVRDCAVLPGDIGASGYRIGHAIALSNLQLGNRVVVDCVNPVKESRLDWAEVAARAGVAWLDVQVVCTDAAEHRRRVETRASDVPGLVLPTWSSVQGHEYEPWDVPVLTIDTGVASVEQAITVILERLVGSALAPSWAEPGPAGAD